MRFLGLDVGERRIGLAVSDPEGRLAASLPTLERRSQKEDFAALMKLVRELSIDAIVVGYPRRMDGTVGPQTQRVERYARALERAVGMPVILWDERLSTVSAERLLIEIGDKRRRLKGRADAVAAAVILQSYLDAQPHPSPPRPSPSLSQREREGEG
jgi:putative Holliday junction resolvase